MNDAERDAWLREALRHAPDSGALPPAAVSETILAQARAAARGDHGVAARGGAPAPTHPLAAFWDWLARPPVAAGFASVMAATLVGLMWWDQPMDETLPRRTGPVASTPPKPAPSEVAPPQGSVAVAKNEEKTTRATADVAAPSVETRVGGAAAVDSIAPARRQAPAEEGARSREATVATAPSGADRERAEPAS